MSLAECYVALHAIDSKLDGQDGGLESEEQDAVKEQDLSGRLRVNLFILIAI
jgi:hypothetical protein